MVQTQIQQVQLTLQSMEVRIGGSANKERFKRRVVLPGCYTCSTTARWPGNGVYSVCASTDPLSKILSPPHPPTTR